MKLKKRKSLSKETFDFLTYLQENEDFPKKRTRNALNEKFTPDRRTRIQGGCDTKDYCRRYEEVTTENGGKEPTEKITIEGTKFIEDYKKERISKINLISTIILTAILILITGFYSFQTWRLNEITYDSFEASNRPYVYIKPFNSGVMKMDTKTDTIELIATVINIGDTPGRLLRMEIIQEGTEKNQLLDLVTLGHDMERNITVYKQGIENNNDFVVKIVYSGIGKFSNEYIFSKHVYINNIGGGVFSIHGEEEEMT